MTFLTWLYLSAGIRQYNSVNINVHHSLLCYSAIRVAYCCLLWSSDINSFSGIIRKLIFRHRPSPVYSLPNPIYVYMDDRPGFTKICNTCWIRLYPVYSLSCSRKSVYNRAIKTLRNPDAWTGLLELSHLIKMEMFFHKKS